MLRKENEELKEPLGESTLTLKFLKKVRNRINKRNKKLNRYRQGVRSEYEWTITDSRRPPKSTVYYKGKGLPRSVERSSSKQTL